MRRFFSSLHSFLHMFWLWFAVLLIVNQSIVNAQVYPIACCYQNGDRKFEDKATAVCIGNSESGKSLLITVKHAIDVENPSVWVNHESKWIKVTRLVKHDTEDLALIECEGRLPGLQIGDATPIDQEVEVSGFGPTFAKLSEDFSFKGKVEEAGILRGTEGEHVMPGDSGGAVVCSTSEGKALVGIITDHEGSIPAKSRRSFVKIRARTGFVPAEKIYAFVQTQYGGCVNGLCPIRVRPTIRQPIVGIGIPWGPPQVVHEATPVPRPDPVYVPQQPQQPEPQAMRGPKGDKGDPGRTISSEDLARAVAVWLEANREQLRGEPGRDGESFKREDLESVVAAWLEANRQDIRSPPPTDQQVAKAAADILFADPERFRGPPGRDSGQGVKDSSSLAKRIAEIETIMAKKQPVQILNADGSIFSQDTERGILDPIVIRLEEPK